MLRRIEVRRRTVKGRHAGFSMPLHPEAAKELQTHTTRNCAGLTGSSPLFASAKTHQGGHGLDRTSAWKLLKKAHIAAGLKERWRAIRPERLLRNQYMSR